MSRQTTTQKAVQTKGKVGSGLASISAQLQQWAHEGSQESLKKLEDFIVKEKNKDLRDYANLAYNEALYFYYSPQNEQDENDFLLSKMIKNREDRFWRLMSEADAAKLELKKLDLERKVHLQLLRHLGKDKKREEDWKYNFSEDYYVTVKNKLIESEDELAYESRWFEEARKMIKNKKYLKVPEEVFEHTHWDGEGGTFWEDEFPEPEEIKSADIPF